MIAGLIPVAWAIYSTNFLETNMAYNTRLFFGYATMVLGFSLIFVGVKNYRDNQNGGVITFGEAIKLSLLITLVASTTYVAIWMVDFYFFLPDFTGAVLESTHAKLVADGKSAAEIKKSMDEMASTMVMYRKPLFNALFTYREIVPPGIVISLIVSAILQRKEPTVAAA